VTRTPDAGHPDRLLADRSHFRWDPNVNSWDEMGKRVGAGCGGDVAEEVPKIGGAEAAAAGAGFEEVNRPPETRRWPVFELAVGGRNAKGLSAAALDGVLLKCPEEALANSLPLFTSDRAMVLVLSSASLVSVIPKKRRVCCGGSGEAVA
jgi:hypothetical protein